VATPPDTKGLAKGHRASSARMAALEQDHKQTRQELQSTREEMLTSQEEAKSANEELQSANEELQSANEELTTSKEEMQSMNEELHTLNQELQAKMDTLAQLNNDMKNLLESTEIASVFLDPALRVRLFTAGSNLIFKLIPGDVGRPITDIASELAYPELADDAREVLRTLVVHEQPAATRDGRWLRVRIMPYRTLENMIDGVAITFTDITASKTLEGKLRTTQAAMEKHIAEQDVKLEQAGAGGHGKRSAKRRSGNP
jgi:two-component system CheB/CheR fusion protein